MESKYWQKFNNFIINTSMILAQTIVKIYITVDKYQKENILFKNYVQQF